MRIRKYNNGELNMKILESIAPEKSGAFMGIMGYIGAGMFEFIPLETWLQAFALGVFSAAGGASGKLLFDQLKKRWIDKRKTGK